MICSAQTQERRFQEENPTDLELSMLASYSISRLSICKFTVTQYCTIIVTHAGYVINHLDANGVFNI